MNKLLTLLLLLVVFHAKASNHPSNSDYTYRKDLKVSNVYQLTNQVFVPNEVVEGKENMAVEAGKVRILIGSDMVAFKGVDGLTAFGIISKIKAPYGYELKLVDSRGSDFLKLAVETDGEDYVETIYLESRHYGDFEFRLPQKSSEQEQAERKYFTAKNACKIYSYFDLKDKTLKPYKRLNLASTSQREEKVAMSENLSLVFDTKKIKLTTGNQSKTLNVRHASIGLERVNGKQMRVMRIRTNKRSQNMSLYLNDKNQIESIQYQTLQYFFM